jgi:hypothetical protein
MWHVRHGTAVTIGNYIVPVPRNWYVENHGQAGQLLVRLDTDDLTPTKRLKAPAAMLFSRSMPISDKNLSLRLSLNIDLLKKQGVESILQRTFNLNDGEVVLCSGDTSQAATVFWMSNQPRGSATHPD